jgi:hypothetical protein
MVDQHVKADCAESEECKMEQYKFNHEELFTLLDPAIRLLKQAESTALCPGKFAFEGAKNLVDDNGYSMACGDFSSAYNWYAERTPVKDVELYHHPGLATLIQLKLLGCAWKILRAVLWQQTQPKTDLYLDRFLMVARYLYDNPDLLVKVAAQYPGVWTNLVDHLEPREVGYQWKRYAALRDIGLAQRETSKPKKSSHDLKLTTNRYLKPSDYSTCITPKASTEHAEKIKKQAQNLAATWCFTPTKESTAIAELLSAWPDYSQPDCVVQFIPKNEVFSPCPVCQHANHYLVTVRKPPVKRTSNSNWCWSAEIECCCGWETTVHFSAHESVAFSEANAVGYLTYLVNRCKEYTRGKSKKTDVPPVDPKGYSFGGGDRYISPELKVPPAADKYWSCVVPFTPSKAVAEAVQDGTFPGCTPEEQHPGWVQYEQNGRVTVYAFELSPAQEQDLEKQYGPFVKTPYTGIIMKNGDTARTVTFVYKAHKTITTVHNEPILEGTVAKGSKALGRELLARPAIKNPLDDIVQGQRNLDAKQEELASTGNVTFDSDLGESFPPWFSNQLKEHPQNEIEELKWRAFTCGIDTTDSTDPGYMGELRVKLLAYLQGQGILDDEPHKGDK